MTYNDAEATMRKVEDEYPEFDVKMISFAPPTGSDKRDYGISFNGPPFPLDVAEFGGLVAGINDIAPAATTSTFTVVPEGGLSFHLR